MILMEVELIFVSPEFRRAPTVMDRRSMVQISGKNGDSWRDFTGTTTLPSGDQIYLGRQLENHQVTISRIANLLGNTTSAKKHLNKFLFIVAIGSNDYINNYLLPEIYPTSHLYTPIQYATALIDQYSQHLRWGVGVRIDNWVSDRGRLTIQLCVGSTNNAIQQFNSKLMSLVDDLNTNFPDAKFTYKHVQHFIHHWCLPLLCLIVHAVKLWKPCLDNVFPEKLHALLGGFIFSR
ncbi:hypothetical protein P3S67_023628 [Capsicum chacoense]